jgi:hypothetical protein
MPWTRRELPASGAACRLCHRAPSSTAEAMPHRSKMMRHFQAHSFKAFQARPASKALQHSPTRRDNSEMPMPAPPSSPQPPWPPHALHLSPLRRTGRILARQIVPKRRFATTAKRAPPGRRRRLATPGRSGSTCRAPSCPCPSWMQFVLAAHSPFAWLKMLSWAD